MVIVTVIAGRMVTRGEVIHAHAHVPGYIVYLFVPPSVRRLYKWMGIAPQKPPNPKFI